MNIEENKSLKAINTFGFEQSAQYYCEPVVIEELKEAIEFAHAKNLSLLMLGEGSNVVLANNIEGLVIRLQNITIDFVATDSHTTVKIGAGVNWHELVLNCVNRDLYGIENLALIPGLAGAAPIQNIGAYGAELSDVLVHVAALDLHTGEEASFDNTDCQFGYRDSLFKSRHPKQFAITEISLALSNIPVVNTQYQALSEELLKRKIDNPTARDISNVVADIRRSKLPDPKELGNAGSFFKNPVISLEHFNQLLQNFPDVPYHKNDDSKIKIPAGWLVEKAGWKGHRTGNVGVHDKQALVLVNFGTGTSKELLELAANVRKSVYNLFDIELVQEPTTIDGLNSNSRSLF